MDTPLGQPVRKQTFAQLGVDRLRATDAPKGTGIGNPVLPGNYDEKPGVPLTMASDAVSAKHTPADGFQFRTTADFHQAYLDGSVSPQDIAERVLKATSDGDRGNRPLRAIIAQDAADVRAQAAASAERWKAGKPLSVFDGVPVPVKDEVWMKGYPTTGGTTFMGKTPEAEDSTVVARMREAGALASRPWRRV